MKRCVVDLKRVVGGREEKRRGRAQIGRREKCMLGIKK